MAKSEFVGVDWGSYGWVSVGLSSNGNHELKVSYSFERLLQHYEHAKLVLVDIPIGLTNGQEKRRCDTQARKILSSSAKVFRPPHRQTAYQAERSPTDYETAKQTECRYAQIGLQKQTFDIAPQIAEVDRVMSPRQSIHRNKVREVHPEICFWALNNRLTMAAGKDTREGAEERIRALKAVWPWTERILDAGCSKVIRNHFKGHDLLDALVAAITAYRGSLDWLQALPERPRRDERPLPIQDAATGLPMEMVFWQPSP